MNVMRYFEKDGFVLAGRMEIYLGRRRATAPGKSSVSIWRAGR